jgi:molybdate transport system substrate-binding protein
VVHLADNTLAAIAPAESQLKGRKPADLARSSARIVLAEPQCPLGRYTRAYLEQMGLFEQFAGRAIWVDNSRAVIAALRAGQADAGIVYGSDAVRADGCRLLFRADQLPVPVRYSAVRFGGANTAAAAALLDFITSPVAAGRFRRCGFLPTSHGPADTNKKIAKEKRRTSRSE